MEPPERSTRRRRRCARWIDAGVDRIYLQILDLSDLEHLDVLATEVAPLLR